MKTHLMTVSRSGTFFLTLAAGTILGLTWAAGSASAGIPIQVQRGARQIQAVTPQIALTLDLKTGRWQSQWRGMNRLRPAIHGADCAVELTDGTTLAASAYYSHSCLAPDVTPIKDALGIGTQIVVHHRAPGHPELRQIFRLYAHQAYFLVRLEVRSPHPLSTRNISPLLIDAAQTPDAQVDLGLGARPRTLFVPYDNDAFVRYNSEYAPSSYEVTAIYDNASRHGFIVGSVSHDLWKTGISMGGTFPHTLKNLRVYGGVTGKETRDTQPHGTVSGNVIVSPLILVGYFPDWRDGLEAYGHANARLTPPIVWKQRVPVGWNSWAAYMTAVSSTNYLAASEFLKKSLMPQDPKVWEGAFVNLDSFWDNLSERQRIEDARQVHARGQKAGIYWTPFVYWGNDLSQKVEGTGGRYTYRDVVLKDASGKPLPTLDGGLPLDPSHPGTLERIDWQCRQFVSWGFDFVKLDFLTHGALEGTHFDPHIMTGTAAYRLGMTRITADLAPSKIGRPFFISLSIAPLFPAGFGHSRRISCDTFGTIGNSEYMLNSLTYGWWEGGTIYAFNDGDHAVLYQAHGQSVTTPAEGRSRLNASVAAGSLILNSDNLLDAKARERILPLLGNREVMALARAGKPFRPVEGDTGSQASDVFVRDDHATGSFYIAVFNYSPSSAATKQISLERVGLSPSAYYSVYDFWTRQKSKVQGSLSVPLGAGSSTLLRLTHE